MSKLNIVCVIDDDEIYTFTAQRIITLSQITEKTIFFHNGKAAIDFFTAHVHQPDQLPDLILLDINMPVLDGWQFMDKFIQLRSEINKPIKIYIVSSSIDEDDYTRAQAIDAITGFIVKPVTVKKLQDIFK